MRDKNSQNFKILRKEIVYLGSCHVKISDSSGIVRDENISHGNSMMIMKLMKKGNSEIYRALVHTIKIRDRKSRLTSLYACCKTESCHLESEVPHTVDEDCYSGASYLQTVFPAVASNLLPASGKV